MRRDPSVNMMYDKDDPFCNIFLGAARKTKPIKREKSTRKAISFGIVVQKQGGSRHELMEKKSAPLSRALQRSKTTAKFGLLDFDDDDSEAEEEEESPELKRAKEKEAKAFETRYASLPENVRNAIMLAHQKKKHTDFYYKLQ